MKKKGFTLIELLVTIVLFSLLLATALYSFQFISINIRNINNTNPKQAVNYNLLRGAFNSVYYYIDTNTQEMSIDKRLYFYFHGKSNQCRFITTSSVFYNQLVIVEIFYKDKELWYTESRIFDEDIDYKQLDKIKMDKRFLVLNNIEELKFNYTFNAKESNDIKKNIPEFIRIDFKSNFKKYSYLFLIKSNNRERLERLKFERKES